MCADFRNNGNCGVTFNTWNGAKKVDFTFVFFHHFIDTGIYLSNHLLKKIMMLPDDFDTKLLFIGNRVTLNGLQNLFCFLFEGTL